jgi:hypothetical protein
MQSPWELGARAFDLSPDLGYTDLANFFPGHVVDPTVGQVYRWRLGLLGLWMEKYESMGRVVDKGQGFP